MTELRELADEAEAMLNGMHGLLGDKRDVVKRVVAVLRARAAEQPTEGAVAWRWRAIGNKHWIYDPTPEWREDHKDDPAVEWDALYLKAPLPAAGFAEGLRAAHVVWDRRDMASFIRYFMCIERGEGAEPLASGNGGIADRLALAIITGNVGNYDGGYTRTAIAAIPVPATSEISVDQLDAGRYRYLRERDLDTISKGGVFAGLTPDNMILNLEDLDAAVDAALRAKLVMHKRSEG